MGWIALVTLVTLVTLATLAALAGPGKYGLSRLRLPHPWRPSDCCTKYSNSDGHLCISPSPTRQHDHAMKYEKSYSHWADGLLAHAASSMTSKMACMGSATASARYIKSPNHHPRSTGAASGSSASWPDFVFVALGRTGISDGTLPMLPMKFPTWV